MITKQAFLGSFITQMLLFELFQNSAIRRGLKHLLGYTPSLDELTPIERAIAEQLPPRRLFDTRPLIAIEQLNLDPGLIKPLREKLQQEAFTNRQFLELYNSLF